MPTTIISRARLQESFGLDDKQFHILIKRGVPRVFIEPDIWLFDLNEVWGWMREKHFCGYSVVEKPKLGVVKPLVEEEKEGEGPDGSR